MKLERVKLADLHEPEMNVRMHTELQLKEFERSVRMFGQIRPLVIDEASTILAGVGLYRTLKRMGHDEADAYRVTGLSENQKKKLMIADNKIFSLGVDDLDNLNVFFESMKADLDVPGFDEEILKAMVADAAEVAEKVLAYGVLSPEDIQAVKEVGERNAERIQRAESNPTAAPSAAAGEPAREEGGGASIICPHCGEKICL